jgi:hypothetical protein
MYCLKAFLAMGIAVFIASSISAESPKEKKESAEVVTIPLAKIWATSMPGTRDIDELVKEQIKLTKVDLWVPLAESFLDPQWWPKAGRTARSAFVVQGDDLKALREAHAVLTGKQKPKGAVSSSKDVTLVFFSQPRSVEVQLIKIQRHDKVVEIQYRIAPFTEKYTELDLALIPLGSLPPGKYEVKITPAPAVVRVGTNFYKTLEPQQLDKSAEIYVSRPFSFNVVDE